MSPQVRGILVSLRGALDGASSLLFMAMRRTDAHARGPLQDVQARLMEARRLVDEAVNANVKAPPHAS